jgi:DNA replication protein DnaC
MATQNNLSQLDQDKNMVATMQPLVSGETRPRTTDEMNRILRDATQLQDDWGTSRDYSKNRREHTGPAPTLDAIIEREFLAEDGGNYVELNQADAQSLWNAAKRRQANIDAYRRGYRLERLCQTIGPRFSEATIDSYQVGTPEQARVMTAVKEYVVDIRDRVAKGGGVVLFGAAGTGKTHLLAAIAKAAIQADLTVEWQNGQDLFAAFRNAIDGDECEADIIRKLAGSDVLVLDDLLPPSGKLTEYQAGNVYRIVDARYCQCRPTMVSMNTASGLEAEHGMGSQVVDRLRHGALTLFCNWDSARKAAT